MDAVKFLEEKTRMCRSCVSCEVCQLSKLHSACGHFYGYEAEKAVKIVENWSRENPEEIGKKYIIEIEEIGNDFLYKYRIKGANILLSEHSLEAIKKYNESEK